MPYLMTMSKKNESIGQQLVTKNISDGLKKLIDQANYWYYRAERKVKEAYEYAVHVDKMTPEQAAIALRANLKYAHSTINKWLPPEAKDMGKARYGISNGQTVKKMIKDAKIEIRSEANVQDAILLPKDTIGANNIKLEEKKKNKEPVLALIVPPAKVKRFYYDLERVKERAMIQGLEVYSDLRVSVLVT